MSDAATCNLGAIFCAIAIIALVVWAWITDERYR